MPSTANKSILKICECGRQFKWGKTCSACYRKEYLKRSPIAKQKAKERTAAWHAANKDRVKSNRRKLYTEKHRFTQYGVTKEWYEILLTAQNNVCAICEETPRDKFVIDHDHTTNKVRGILCTNCNVGLGCFLDDKKKLQNAISYLDRYGK